MNSWDRLGLAPTDPPSISELASSAFGIDVSKSLRSELELKVALISECIRIGLYLFREEDEPVHKLRLRNWVFRKLGSVLPELLLPERSDYLDILEKLEFLGDVTELSEGYLEPGCAICVQTGPGSHILVSGHPTRGFQTLRDRIKITRFGRRLEGTSQEELTRLGIVSQPINKYLNLPDDETPKNLISRILSTSRQQVPVNPTWDVYKDRRGSHGFYWGSYSERETNLVISADFEGRKISLLREPMGEDYWRYWLQVVSASDKWYNEADSRDWKRVCLALDYLTGHPREVTAIVSRLDSEFRLSIDFPLFKALFRWLNAEGSPSGRDEWKLPLSVLEQTRRLLEISGVAIHMLKEGE